MVATAANHSDALAAAARRIAQACRPRTQMRSVDWVPRYMRLPADVGATAGLYDLDRYPFWRGVLEAADDPETEQIAIEACTQLGKTTFLQVLLAARSELSPAPAMLAGPDRDFIRDLRDKIYKLCEASPPLNRRVPPVRARNDRWIDLETCLVYLAFSGSPQRMSGRPCALVCCTEVDRWQESPREGATAKLVAERVKAFYRSLIVYEGTPTDDGSAIDALYQDSDQRTFQVPCTKCGHYQELRFFLHRDGPYVGCGGVGGLKDEEGNWVTSDEARELAYYICERGCRLDDADKTVMVSRGVWCPAGQRVVKGKLVGTPHRGPRIAGFALNSLYSDTVTCGRMAAEYLDSRGREQRLRNFINNWLGKKYTPTGRVPEWKVLGRRLEAAHPSGLVPAATYFLTCGTDVQEGHCYWVVRAWGEFASSWLVDRGRCEATLTADGVRRPNSDLDQLDGLVLDRVFPLVAPNPLGLTTLQVRLMGCDTGFEPHRVWSWVRPRLGGDRVRAIAGDAQMNEPWFRKTVVEKSARDGKIYEGGMERWGINTDAYKCDLHDRWGWDVTSQGAWLFCRDIITSGEDYLRQLVNEYQASEVNRSGREVRVWKVRDHALGNHYLDCEVYARALADMVVGLDWSNLPALFRPVSTAPVAARERSGGFIRKRERRASGGFIRRR